MKKLLSLIVIPAAALGVALAVGQPRGVDDWGDGDYRYPPSHEQIAKFTGTWLVAGEFNSPFELVYKLSADGGVAASGGLYLNADGSPSYLTTAFGAWKRTGRQTMAASHLIRIVGDDGTLQFYEKIVAELAIEDGVLTGEAVGAIYLPNQDPSDPEVAPVLILGPSPIVGQRIKAETLVGYVN